MKKKIFTLLTLLVACVTGAWADDVIFSMTSKTNPTSVSAGSTVDVTATFAPSGSSAKFHNGHASNEATMNANQVNLAGSGNSYFHATFTTELAEGDVITLSQNDKFIISDASTGGSTVDFPYTIPENSSLIGKTDIYLRKDNTGTKAFTSITITRPTGTLAPNISFSGTTVTLTCATDGATIYYTTDGSTPTTSSLSKTTGQTFEIPNSCTVRAFAQKDEDASAESTRDCYVDHSESANFLTILKFNGGAIDGEDANLWTSTDGKYSLRDENNPQTYKYTSLEAGNDAFKLSHVDGYTLTVPSDVKVTKVAFIGKSLYEGYTATVKVTGFNSNNAKSFIEYPTDGIKCLSTIEFAPDAALGYGESIEFNPGGCESAAYIELYGVVTTSPSDPVAKETVTQTVTFTKSSGTTTCSDADILTMTGGGYKDATYDGYAGAMELSSDASITIKLPTGATNASVTLLGTNASTTLKLNSDSRTAVTWSGDNTNGYTLTIPIDDSYAGGTYTIRKGDGSSRIHKITLTYLMPSETKITLTTSANMAGWRAFYDASNSYTLDGNTTAYVATAESAGTVTMTPLVGGVPSGTPVILKTTSSADSYKMTLTKASVSAYGGTNLLSWETSAVDSKYRLGYGAEGVGFYPYSGTPSSGAVILNVDSNAPVLTLDFGNSTGINTVNGSELKVNGEYYNLAGQRVANPTKGLYIVNGKKVIVK